MNKILNMLILIVICIVLFEILATIIHGGGIIHKLYYGYTLCIKNRDNPPQPLSDEKGNKMDFMYCGDGRCTKGTENSFGCYEDCICQ